jgi:hypothetical protein
VQGAFCGGTHFDEEIERNEERRGQGGRGCSADDDDDHDHDDDADGAFKDMMKNVFRLGDTQVLLLLLQ